MSQIQATGTKVFGPTPWERTAWAFVTEVAMMHVHDMPDWNELKPLESPADGRGRQRRTPPPSGYRVAARLDYNNAVGAVNLFPYLQFRHDFKRQQPYAERPVRGGPDRADPWGSVPTISAAGRADLGYTRFAGIRNKLRDRDFITATIKYSF